MRRRDLGRRSAAAAWFFFYPPTRPPFSPLHVPALARFLLQLRLHGARHKACQFCIACCCYRVFNIAAVVYLRRFIQNRRHVLWHVINPFILYHPSSRLLPAALLRVARRAKGSFRYLRPPAFHPQIQGVDSLSYALIRVY